MVTGESPGEDEVSPPADDVTLQTMVTKEAFFVDFLRTDEHDEDGVRKPSTIGSHCTFFLSTSSPWNVDNAYSDCTRTSPPIGKFR